MQARPPAKPTRHSPEAKPMAYGQGEAAWGTSGQVSLHGEANPVNMYKFSIILSFFQVYRQRLSQK
jgi:hypothetical protein